jgi:NADH pyrophosphatase NudC (nudix superfamily)
MPLVDPDKYDPTTSEKASSRNLFYETPSFGTDEDDSKRTLVSTRCHQCGLRSDHANFCPKCGTPRAPNATRASDKQLRTEWFDREPPYILPDCENEHCHRALIPEWKYCPGCGTEVPLITPDLSVRCPKCRYRYDIEQGERFCPNDGTPIPDPTTEKRKRRWWSFS